ncbi:HlyD family type I secretion periplasmic adaptor subunit [Thiorhodospira sibirica]|uniref:HlyD family type I secretion periplasmic adaptor subunit n=1 Tax=Thiorhodospira sibirica TaxID=154347 RepID=UPI00022C2DBE|nr:HlyD family type I secretion periplasmic adaptor subunit [Thiorhodospira sibirica]
MSVNKPIEGKVLAATPSERTLDVAPDPHQGAIERSPASIVVIGWLVMLLGFFGFLIWAALAPLDSGVTAPGEIVVDSSRQKVQHLTGGIVDEILVRDGDHVERHDVLIRLNRTRPQSELAIVRAQLLSSQAVEARLLAERDGRKTIDFPPSVLDELNDPRIADVVRTQRQLFASRRDGLLSELSILDENLRGIDEQVKGLRAQEEGKARQVALLQEELEALRRLFDEGYVPRNRIFELERMIADVQARRSEDLSAIARAQSSLSEVRLRKIQRQQEYSKEVESELTGIQREVDSLEQRRIALQDELERIEIRAPVAGVVVGMRVHSLGSIIRPGDDILDLVPDGEPLVIKAQVAPQSIELVHVGLEAMIRFSALSTLNPVVNGLVVNVSADRLTDERTGMPYFEARIEVPVEELARLTYERIIPGMPAEVVIRTGENTVLHYLLKPVLDHIFSAFRER